MIDLLQLWIPIPIQIQYRANDSTFNPVCIPRERTCGTLYVRQGCVCGAEMGIKVG